MCGIAGIIASDTSKLNTLHLKKMTDIIAHRGPDGEGHWISANGAVGLGHRRLSIIDLSNEADQPMHYLGRYTIVFNGEIYNYKELKQILLAQGYTFKTSSDTEVLIALYHRDKEKCLQLLDGMFAFVIYDNEQNEIFAARDRFGEKPFFYSYETGKNFYFGSEMKCLWAAGIPKEVNNVMLYNYLENDLLSNPDDDSQTFYNKCTRLPHSHYLKLKVANLEVTIQKYYDIDYHKVDNEISITAAQEKFHELFFTSISRRLRSDVTVGSSLSGGLDSSLVVTAIDALKKGTGQKQDTFSAVFPGFLKDERKYMDYVTARTNVTPHYITPTDEGMIDSLDKLAFHQEEPYRSASIYVQYCVMQLAKENHTTVLLDGQGADEILAGYHNYYTQYFNELKKADSKKYQKEIAAYSLLHADNDINDNVRRNLLQRVKASTGIYLPAVRKLYQKVKYKNQALLNNDFYQTYKKTSFKKVEIFENLNHCLYSSTMQYGLQELLRYADRNSMAHSREIRLPFLSHELVEFLFSLPAEMKIKNGWTKWIMRETFQQELPAEIAWRKDKIGYEPPQKKWMNNEKVQQSLKSSINYLTENKVITNTAIDKISPAMQWKILAASKMIFEKI